MLRRTLKRLLSGMTRPRRVVRVYRRRKGIAGTTLSYERHKEDARKVVHQKLKVWNAYYGYVYKRVAIRNQRSRWGSCSTKGNLNFHYRLLYLPEELQDYIIVHELCHLAAFDHSQNFWDLVARTIPDHALRRKALRGHARAAI